MSKYLKINITGECLVTRDNRWAYPVYKAKLSSNFGGEWDYTDIQLEFPKGTELKNETFIKINNAFLTFFRRKTGEIGYKIKITNFDISNAEVGEIDIPATINSDDDTELPF